MAVAARSCGGRVRQGGPGGGIRAPRALSLAVVVAVMALSVPASAPARAEEPGAVVVKPLATATTTADGRPIRLPQGDVRVALSEYVIAPGAKLPVHRHPHTRLAYVIEGTLDVTDVDAGETWSYKPGDLIVEVVDRWHFGVNTGTTPVRLLVLDEAPDGAAVTVTRD